MDKKRVLGMIHLAGSDPVQRALQEVEIYHRNGVAGAIVENYHGSVSAVEETLAEIQKLNLKNFSVGVNILPNDYIKAFELANEYGAKFIQLDYVSGSYERTQPIDELKYQDARKAYPSIHVLGGVWPKYYTPIAGSDLNNDLRVAMRRCDAIVVTGSGTGKETPLDKIKRFRSIVGDQFQLIVGAGINVSNAAEQLKVANGAIVGSFFKNHGRTQDPVREELVQELMKKI